LATTANMSDHGRFYFYASRPEINDREAFNHNCKAASEQTVVLGCYASQRIYVFDITDQRLAGIKEVTAAHEMLHAAYDRLSKSEKDRVHRLLEAELESINDKRIRDLIAIYDQTEPGERLNELHSILATEMTKLSSELETYYQQYFIDRSSVVALSKQYESVFSSIKEQQASLLAELNDLAAKITANSENYNRDATRLNADIAAFNQRANNDGYTSQAAFNADRQILVDRQNQIANDRESINASIAAYNEKREVLQGLNGQAQELNQSINSNSLEPSPSL